MTHSDLLMSWCEASQMLLDRSFCQLGNGNINLVRLGRLLSVTASG